ncbi:MULTISPECIES: hypothetical protein [unclassified Rickettsia]
MTEFLPLYLNVRTVVGLTTVSRLLLSGPRDQVTGGQFPILKRRAV